MKITEVRIKLMEGTEDRLRGFCSITFDDCFVVRDLKIILGNSGAFVAMPSRKLSSHCQKCRSKNHLKAKYCNNCGTRQRSDHIPFDTDGRAKLYADIAHPVNASCREMIQSRVIEEYERELERASQPGYRSRYDDSYESSDDYHRDSRPAAVRTDPPHTAKPTDPKTSDPKADSEPLQGPHRSAGNKAESVEPSTGPPKEGEEGFGNGILD